MAKRADIRAIFDGVEVTDAQISKLMNLIHNETDALKDERDTLQAKLDEATANGGKDAQTWKDKYDAEHSAFETFKADQTKKETEAKKREAYKELLKDSKLSDKGREKALKYANLEDIELDDKGAVKGGKKLLDDIHEEWSDYATETQTQGQNTPDRGAEGANNNNGGSVMTKADIMKISDTSARQKAIMENPQAFQ